MEKLLPNWLARFFSLPGLTSLGKAFLLVVVGVQLSRFLSRKAREYLDVLYSHHHGLVAEKITFYGLGGLFLAASLNQLGFSLTPLLGAAGVIGIAVGFASQTSMSNVISGLFILAEKPFSTDDVVEVGGVTGVVMSIDLLSVKLRTFDNKFVRIPNETILKATVTNITRFPIRRVDATIPLPIMADISQIKEMLLDVAKKDKRILKLPEKFFYFKGIGESNEELMFFVWVATPDWFAIKNWLPEAILERLEKEGIVLPCPHITVHQGGEWGYYRSAKERVAQAAS